MKENIADKLRQVSTAITILAVCSLLAGCKNTPHAAFVGDSRWLDILWLECKPFFVAICLLLAAAWFWLSGKDAFWTKLLAALGGACLVLAIGLGWYESGQPCDLDSYQNGLNDCPAYKQKLEYSSPYLSPH